ncbi:hypothetical protein GCM10017586_23270 [Microbacterium imperiale]|uniref:Uncharacterized protein n=1 Tax=Microbacterium imperiale TaxID=33884 RepID=A0A9W6HHD8_9MICO|nr:hypothetical protein GCM10017586_23270 [Microbacterium imperiale]
MNNGIGMRISPRSATQKAAQAVGFERRSTYEDMQPSSRVGPCQRTPRMSRSTGFAENARLTPTAIAMMPRTVK